MRIGAEFYPLTRGWNLLRLRMVLSGKQSSSYKGFRLYNVPERGCGVYTLGYDAIPELKSRRNQLNQEGNP